MLGEGAGQQLPGRFTNRHEIVPTPYRFDVTPVAPARLELHPRHCAGGCATFGGGTVSIRVGRRRRL